jgi:hypothetical protein
MTLSPGVADLIKQEPELQGPALERQVGAAERELTGLVWSSLLSPHSSSLLLMGHRG